VKGSAQAGGLTGPKKYSAFEPDLMMWVLATLIHAALQGYQLVFGRVDDQRRESYFQDMKRFGTYFGLPQEFGPQKWPEFIQYFDEMTRAGKLAQHPVCREIADGILFPQHPQWLKPLVPPVRHLTAEFLPSALLEPLGLDGAKWSSAQNRAFHRWFPSLYFALPAPLRFAPEYRRAVGLLRN
jgi:uncharacterized protein (DUF2236 family)